jgi:hypothetical protein
MASQSEADPFPSILYQLHTHGSAFPRFINEDSSEYCNSFRLEKHFMGVRYCLLLLDSADNRLLL